MALLPQRLRAEIAIHVHLATLKKVLPNYIINMYSLYVCTVVPEVGLFLSSLRQQKRISEERNNQTSGTC